ncbi:MAG: hypothetical protein OXC37_03215 [Bdellovibrionaceae bacterium]|nr:hypothetical protein [Pseudobdellovibrionaceae bacterium]
MGCRVCVQFINSEYGESPIIYAHAHGAELAEIARDYLIKLYKETKKRGELHLQWKNPYRVLANFMNCWLDNDYNMFIQNSNNHYAPDDAGLYKFILGEKDFTIKHIPGEFQSQPVVKRS